MCHPERRRGAPVGARESVRGGVDGRLRGKQGRRARGDAGRSARRLRQPGPSASFEAPRTFEEAGTPGEQPALIHPSRGEREAGAGQALRHPEDPAKGESPGSRSRGEWTVTARWPGVDDATSALPTGRFVVRSPKEHAPAERPTRRAGRNPMRSASRVRARSPTAGDNRAGQSGPEA